MNPRTCVPAATIGAIGIMVSHVLAQPMLDTHRSVQQVDANGNCVHPLIGAPMLDAYGQPIEENKVQLTGIAISGPGELVDTASEYLLIVQGEGEDHAGTQLWSGIFFHDPAMWPEHSLDILPGDRVRVTGFIMDFIGKTNMNERHSGDPAVNFQIEVLEHVGMPDPEVVPTVAHANFFDMTRMTGGEWYQSRWVRLNSVEIVGGEAWANGNQVVISDGTGELGMMLGASGDFDTNGPPVGKFDVVAVFDQEPHPLDFGGDKKANYRIWVRSWSDIIEPTAPPVLVHAASRRTHGAVDLDIDLPLAGDPACETRRDGLTTLVLTFNEGVQAIDGTLDETEITLSVGNVDAVWLEGLDLVVQVSGVPDGSEGLFQGTCLDASVSGIADLAGNPLLGDHDVRVKVLAGNLNNDLKADLTDMSLSKTVNGSNLNDAAAVYDVNLDGKIDLTDMSLVRDLNGGWLVCQ